MRYLTLLLLLGACADERWRNDLYRVEPGTGQIVYDRDLYDCRREALQPRYSRAGVFADAGVYSDSSMTDLCMRARGWRRL